MPVPGVQVVLGGTGAIVNVSVLAIFVRVG